MKVSVETLESPHLILPVLKNFANGDSADFNLRLGTAAGSDLFTIRNARNNPNRAKPTAFLR
jgi:hypothetical protein